MGGATGGNAFVCEQAGADYAGIIWKMFLSGSDPSLPRPFGNAVIDGVDLDIEGGSSTGYTGFTNKLREYYATDAARTYYVSGAP